MPKTNSPTAPGSSKSSPPEAAPFQRAKRLTKVPPERLPRRAVRGLGAHSPHPTAPNSTPIQDPGNALNINYQKYANNFFKKEFATERTSPQLPPEAEQWPRRFGRAVAARGVTDLSGAGRDRNVGHGASTAMICAGRAGAYGPWASGRPSSGARTAQMIAPAALLGVCDGKAAAQSPRRSRIRKALRKPRFLQRWGAERPAGQWAGLSWGRALFPVKRTKAKRLSRQENAKRRRNATGPSCPPRRI